MKAKSILLILSSLLLLSCQQKTPILIKNSTSIEHTSAELDSFFQSLIDSMEIPGLAIAIVNDSKVAYHKTFGVISQLSKESVTKETIFEAASLSKPLFAYFVMKQVEKGLLDLDKPLHEYLRNPDLAHDERAKLITARMVLSHSSGLPNWRQDSLKIAFAPGSKYSYSGEGYEYLAQVIAKVNQVPLTALDSIFQIEVAHQIDAERLYFAWNDDITNNKASGHMHNEPATNKQDYKDDHFSAAGGLHVDAQSYAKFIISLFDNSILSSDLRNELLAEQIKLPEDDINRLIIGASGWSLGFGMIPVENKVYYFHGGNNDDFQSWMHFYPEKKYGIVVLSNSDKIQNPEFFGKFFNFMQDGLAFDLSKLN